MDGGGGVGRPETLGERLTCGECGHEGADEDIACTMGADERNGKCRQDHGIFALPHPGNPISACCDHDGRKCPASSSAAAAAEARSVTARPPSCSASIALTTSTSISCGELVRQGAIGRGVEADRRPYRPRCARGRNVDGSGISFCRISARASCQRLGSAKSRGIDRRLAPDTITAP